MKERSEIDENERERHGTEREILSTDVDWIRERFCLLT